MNRIAIITLFAVLLLFQRHVVAQDSEEDDTPIAFELPAPAPDKALVIFTRPPLEAPVIQFQYYDGGQYLGKIGPGSYLVYECDPGSHVLWGKSENMSFIDADLEAGRVYLVNTRVTSGLTRARVDLVPYDPTQKNAERLKNRLLRRISTREEIRVQAGALDVSDHAKQAARGLERYEQLKAKETKLETMAPDMYVQ
jgi:Protein of unknown function (DUF2846).